MLITSASNPTLKLVRKLLAQKRKREELGLFAVEGEDLVEAAAAAGIEPIERLVAGENVEPELLAAISTLPAPGSRRRRLPHRRPAARAARDDAGALARLGSRQHRHAAARRGRLRRGGRALRGLRRPARLEGAARVRRGDLPCPAARVRRRSRPAGRARRARRRAAARARPLRPGDVRARSRARRGCREDVVADSNYVATIATTGAAESLNVAVAGAIALYERSRQRAHCLNRTCPVPETSLTPCQRRV